MRATRWGQWLIRFGSTVRRWGIAAVGIAQLAALGAIGPAQAGGSSGAKVTVQNKTLTTVRVWIYNSDDIVKAAPTEQKDMFPGTSQQFGCNSKGACRVVVQLWLGNDAGYGDSYDLATYSSCVMVAVPQGTTTPVGQVC